MKTFHNLYILVLLLALPLAAKAVSIAVQAPSQVAAGQQFYLKYVIGTADVKGFRLGNIPDAFNVLMGPSTSTQQSFRIIQGQASHTATVTYTYVLMAVKNGTFTIPSAHATVNGNAMASEPMKITVSGSVPQQQGGGQQQQQRPQQRVDRAGSRISGNDLFIKVTANKQRVYEQEPVLLTYKVYTQVELTQLEGKMPDLNGFHTQEIPLPHQKSFHTETLNGKPYNCVTWSQYVMFPQMAGKLEIPALTFKGIVVQQNPNIDPLEAFLNGGAGYIEVQKEIKAPGVTIQVDTLPAKPANFSGGVGAFTVSAAIDKSSVKAGDPVTLTFVVSGTGNLKLVKQPELQLPNDFDKYDPKVTDKTKISTEGITGNMVYETLIVPRNKGKYTIPAMEFVYFDTKANVYRTLTTQPIELNVEKGSGNGSGVTDYSRPQDNDISDIITGQADADNPLETFFGSKLYIGINALVLIVFLMLCIIFRKRAMDMANISAMRGKKANKVAGKRLKKAARLLKQGKGEDFYDEVLRALWGYVGDKLNIPVERLSRDNISQRLAEKSVDETVINSFIEAIDECEFARYAPGDPAGNMQKTYDKATEAITNIEGGMKRRTSTPPSAQRRATGILMMMLFSATTAIATPAADSTAAASQNANYKANADAAYRNADYQQAITLYEKELQQGMSAATYHNLGNAYYRTDNVPMAILSYEKAKKLAPMDERIQHSLDIARSKTIDKLPPESDVFFAQWIAALRNTLTIDQWGKASIGMLVAALLLFLVYLFMENMLVRRLSFYASSLLFLLFVVANIFAWQRKNALLTHDSAVVMKPAVSVKSSPTDTSADACVIHEGTWIRITDSEMKGWYGIRLSDGREGWLKTADVAEI